jgi:hypothetical protein
MALATLDLAAVSRLLFHKTARLRLRGLALAAG